MSCYDYDCAVIRATFMIDQKINFPQKILKEIKQILEQQREKVLEKYQWIEDPDEDTLLEELYMEEENKKLEKLVSSILEKNKIKHKAIRENDKFSIRIDQKILEVNCAIVRDLDDKAYLEYETEVCETDCASAFEWWSDFKTVKKGWIYSEDSEDGFSPGTSAWGFKETVKDKIDIEKMLKNNIVLFEDGTEKEAPNFEKSYEYICEHICNHFTI